MSPVQVNPEIWLWVGPGIWLWARPGTHRNIKFCENAYHLSKTKKAYVKKQEKSNKPTSLPEKCEKSLEKTKKPNFVHEIGIYLCTKLHSSISWKVLVFLVFSNAFSRFSGRLVGLFGFFSFYSGLLHFHKKNRRFSCLHACPSE